GCPTEHAPTQYEVSEVDRCHHAPSDATSPGGAVVLPRRSYGRPASSISSYPELRVELSRTSPGRWTSSRDCAIGLACVKSRLGLARQAAASASGGRTTSRYRRRRWAWRPPQIRRPGQELHAEGDVPRPATAPTCARRSSPPRSGSSGDAATRGCRWKPSP